MAKNLSIFLVVSLLVFGMVCMTNTNNLYAATWMIGDNDGYGAGIADNANHNFNGYTANYDGRSAAEKTATNGAQYTDTYSTTHSGYAPQPGTVATFTFTGLGSGWTEGSMWFDMADFQASTFGAVIVTYNGILQNWAFNDGFPHTKVRFFDLEQNVVDSINATGELIVAIDRNRSSDFYGFDYAMLSNRIGENTNTVPEPSTIILLGAGLVGAALLRKKKNS
ncbi:MAG: PEP-CTERM sorting domain-containing protein [Nitrospirae bacterium]|nr:PEP-CTERM sorting domain-containing protein [Nitrospirota bacterium]